MDESEFMDVLARVKRPPSRTSGSRKPFAMILTYLVAYEASMYRAYFFDESLFGLGMEWARADL